MRTRPVALALCAVLSMVAAAPAGAAPPAAPRSAWTQEGRDAAGTSWNPEEDVLVAATVADVRPLWRAPRPAQPGGGLTANDGSEPVVAGGRLFVEEDGHVTAYAADGCGEAAGHRCPPRWVTPDLAVDGSTPAYAAGSLLVASTAAFGATSTVYAIDPATGAERWRLPLDPPAPHSGYVDVVAAGDLAYLSVQQQVTVFAAGGCGEAVCSPLWSVRVADATVHEPKVAGGVLYVAVRPGGGDEGYVAAFDAGGCGEAVCTTPQWRTETFPLAGSPAVGATTLFHPRLDRTVAAFPAAGCGGPVCPAAWATTPADSFQFTVAVTDEWLVTGWGSGVGAYDVGGCGLAACRPAWRGAGGGHEVSVAGDLVWTRENSQESEVFAFRLDGCRRSPCQPVATLDYRSSKRAGAWEGAAVVVDGRAYVHYVTGVVVYGLPHDFGTGT